MKRLLGSAVLAVLTMMTLSSLAMACHWALYQPEVPASLR
ncbi:MAG: cyclic lactone autoinducer peptide [Betaproteobacteria bacterium]